jgi:hypothetical protein
MRAAVRSSPDLVGPSGPTHRVHSLERFLASKESVCQDLAFVLAVGPDGSLASDSGAAGFLYAFANAELVFTVSAVDRAGAPLDGEIVVST